MKPRTLIILWIIVLLLGAAVFIVKNSNSNSGEIATARAPGEKLIPDFPATKTQSIEISGMEDTVTLTKKDDLWTVSQRDGFPANTSAVNDLIRSLATLKVTQGIKAGPSFAPRFGMDPDSSVLAERGITATLKDGSGKVLAKVSFGKNLEAASSSPYGGGSTGRYVRNHPDESGFYAVAELFSSLSADPKSWLQEEFVKIEQIQTISLSKPGSDDNEWELTRENENGDFKFTQVFPGVKVDPAAVSPLKSLFSPARFDDVIPASEVEKLATPDKLQKTQIKTFDGLTYDITLQPSQPIADEAQTSGETFLMTVAVSGELPKERKKPEGETEEQATAAEKAFTERRDTLVEQLEKTKKLEGRTFEVSRFTVDALLKNRTALMDKGPGPSETPQPPTPGTSAFTPPIQIPAQPSEQTIPTQPEE